MRYDKRFQILIEIMKRKFAKFFIIFFFIIIPLFSFAAIIQQGKTYNGYRCSLSYGCNTNNISVQPTNSGVNIYGWEAVSGSGISCAKPPKIFKDFICIVTESILSPLIPILIGLAVVVFLWGILKYITAGGDEKKRSEGIKFMAFGIIGLFVMVSVWGLVNILTGTFGLNEGSAPFPRL